MRNQMGLYVSGTVIDLSQVPVSILVVHFDKIRTKLPKQILIEVRRDLLGVIVHLDQAAIIFGEKRKKEEMYVKDSVTAVHYRKNTLRNVQIDRHKRAETVHDKNLETDRQDSFGNGEP